MRTVWVWGDQLRLEVVDNDHVTCHWRDVDAWAGDRERLRMEDFYRWRRRTTGYLMDGDEQPAGGRWNQRWDVDQALHLRRRLRREDVPGVLCSDCRYDPRQRTGEDACPFTTLYGDVRDRNRETLAGNHRLNRPLATLDRLSDLDDVRSRAREVRSALADGTL